MMSAKDRRIHNVTHKKHLAQMRIKIRRAKKMVTRVDYRFKMAWAKKQHLNEAKQGGLIKFPKEKQQSYDLNYHNKKLDYQHVVKHLKLLEKDFNLMKYGKKPKYLKEY